MKTNVGKSGVLHLRKKRARRTVDRFYICILVVRRKEWWRSTST